MDITRYLYVTRPFNGSFDADEIVRTSVHKHFPGAEAAGSGAGFGTRDMDFIVPDSITQEQLNALKGSISDQIGECMVLYDEWQGDECTFDLIGE